METTSCALLAALPLCRLPYPTMWVESLQQDRAEWIEKMTRRGNFRPQHIPRDQQPHRNGFLLTQDGPDRIVVTQMLSMRSGVVGLCGEAIVISTGEIEPDPVQTECLRQLYSGPPPAHVTAISWWPKTEAEIAAVVELSNRIDLARPPFLAPMMGLPGAEEAFERWMKPFDTQNLLGEWRFIVAFLTVLNSRNLITYADPPDQTKLNRSRVAKGKPPLLSHQEIRLNLSRVLRNRLGAVPGDPRAAAQAHLVRGHWKLRKTGIYWWSSFVRGGTTAAPKTYKVVDTKPKGSQAA